MDWHKRYLQQASWTRELRAYLMKKAGISGARRILEVGSGTGVILREVAQTSAGPGGRSSSIHGLDLRAESLLHCRLHEPSAHLSRADALALPYADAVFDITFCHFLLLWVKEPGQALREMRRVTCRHGHVLALAEPDYSARVDRPDALAVLGKWQERSLARQGANTAIGSRVAELFRDSGLEIIETGALSPWQPQSLGRDDLAGEWEMLREDLNGLVPESELDRMMKLDAQARQRAERILHVPTYFVHAQV